MWEEQNTRAPLRGTLLSKDHRKVRRWWGWRWEGEEVVGLEVGGGGGGGAGGGRGGPIPQLLRPGCLHDITVLSWGSRVSSALKTRHGAVHRDHAVLCRWQTASWVSLSQIRRKWLFPFCRFYSIYHLFKCLEVFLGLPWALCSGLMSPSLNLHNKLFCCGRKGKETN